MHPRTGYAIIYPIFLYIPTRFPKGGDHMGLFRDPAETERKNKLKALEDKRVAFAAKLAAESFAPEKMFFVQTANGGFVAVSSFKNQRCLIIAPGFGTDEDFVLERHDVLNVRKEDVFVASEGLAGAFGLGKKGEAGIEYIITRLDGSELSLPVVCGRNSWMECTAKKNPLLDVKRRRGNTNIVWDMRPVEKRYLDSILKMADEYLGI